MSDAVPVRAAGAAFHLELRRFIKLTLRDDHDFSHRSIIFLQLGLSAASSAFSAEVSLSVVST
jgi:hypothetical protein